MNKDLRGQRQGRDLFLSGNKQVGEGRMTVVDAKPNEQLDIKLEFIKPFESTNQTQFTFQAAGDKTTVT